jgi:cell division septation protein DedD
MDNAMVKRGIGAVVLAVIAALLLGYLLKDKSREREEVVMKLPKAPEMNIPSLTGSLTGSTDTNAEAPSLLDNAKATISDTTSNVSDTIKESGSAIIASATGATDQATDAVTDTVKTTMDSTSTAIQGMKPGFAIRPSLQNEEKEIVDTTNSSANNTPKIEKTAKKAKETIIASSNNTAKASTKKKFKPEIVKNKKPAKKREAPKQQAKAPVKPKAPINNSISTAPLGKYSIQLLATSSQSRANKLAKTMKGEGYKVFVTQATREDKILYRVRVGGHADRTSAIKAQEGMKRRYLNNFFVQNSLVISN